MNRHEQARRELSDYRVCRRGQIGQLYAINRINNKKINGTKLGDLWPVLKRQFLEAEARRIQQAQADKTSNGAPQLLNHSQQGTDQPSVAVQQPKQAEQATTSLLNPAKQFSVGIQAKKLATPRPPPVQAKSASKVSLTLGDYLVFRKGGILSIINRVTGKKEIASTLGPKYSVLKRQFFEIEDQAEKEANGEVSETYTTPPQKVDRLVQQIKLAEHASVAIRQPDEPAKQSTVTNMSVEQPSTVNQPNQSPAIAGPLDNFMFPTQNNHRKLMNTKIPTKPIHTRKPRCFKKPITALKHEWKAKIAKGLPLQCHNYERCHFQCASATDMEYHYLKCGTDITVYTCKCGRFYANKASFERHAVICCEVFRCSHCGKTFQNFTLLVNHTAQCPMIPNSDLKQAAADIVGNKMMYKMFYKCCSVCRDVFVSADYLSRHQTIMHSSSSAVTTGSTALTSVTTTTVTMELSTTMTPTSTIKSSPSNTADGTTMVSAAITTTSVTTNFVGTMTTASLPPCITMATLTATSPTRTLMTIAPAQDSLPLAVTTTSSPSITCTPQSAIHSNPPSLPPILHDNRTNLISSSSHHSSSQVTTSVNSSVICTTPNIHSSADDADFIPLQDINTCSSVSDAHNEAWDTSGENSCRDKFPKENNVTREPSKEIGITEEPSRVNNITGELCREFSITGEPPRMKNIEKPSVENSITGEPPRESNITGEPSRQKNSITGEPLKETNITGELPRENSITGKPPKENGAIMNRSGSDHKQLRRQKPFDFERLQDHHRTMVVNLWKKQLREKRYIECPMYEYCGIRLGSIYEILYHYRLCGAISCPLCVKTFTVMSKFTTHYIMEHNKPPQVTDRKCVNSTDARYDKSTDGSKTRNCQTDVTPSTVACSATPTSGTLSTSQSQSASTATQISLSSTAAPISLMHNGAASIPSASTVVSTSIVPFTISTSASTIPTSITSSAATSIVPLCALVSATPTRMGTSILAATPTNIIPKGAPISATPTSVTSTVALMSATPTSTIAPITATPTSAVAPITATPTSAVEPITVTPTSAVAPITATPTSAAEPITVTPTSAVAPITATPTSAVEPITATPTSAIESITATPTSVTPTVALISATPTSAVAPITATPTSAVEPITAISTSAVAPITATPTSAVEPITATPIIASTVVVIPTSVKSVVTPTTRSAGTQQGELPTSTSLNDDKQTVQRIDVDRSHEVAGQKRSRNDGIDSGGDGEKHDRLGKKCKQSASHNLCCKACKKHFATKNDVLIHEKECKSNWQCKSCGLCFSVKSDLTHHKRLCEQAMQCEKCGRKYHSVYGLKKHMMRCTKLQASGSSSSVQSEVVPSRKQSGELPYYFCDTCGKVYVTQDDLTEHRSSAHGNASQQSQSSQTGDPIDNSTNKDAAQHDQDASAVESSPSINVTVTSENGETDKKKKVQMGLLFRYWRTELKLNGFIRCPMYKYCGCQLTSVHGMKHHYTQCGTIACPCCDRTFTTMKMFHPHFMNTHHGQVPQDRTNDVIDKRAVANDSMSDIAAMVVNNVISVANDELLTARRKKYKYERYKLQSKASSNQTDRNVVIPSNDSTDKISDVDKTAAENSSTSESITYVAAPSNNWEFVSNVNINNTTEQSISGMITSVTTSSNDFESVSDGRDVSMNNTSELSASEMFTSVTSLSIASGSKDVIVNNIAGQSSPMAECSSSDSSLLSSDGPIIQVERSTQNDTSEVFDPTEENEVMYQDNQTEDMDQNYKAIEHIDQDYIDVVNDQDTANDQDNDSQLYWRASSHHCRSRSVTAEVLPCGWGWLAPGWGWLPHKDKKFLSVSSARTRPIQKHATNRHIRYTLVQNQQAEGKESYAALAARNCPWKKDSVYLEAKQARLPAIRRQRDEEMTQKRHIEEKENSAQAHAELSEEEKQSQEWKSSENTIQDNKAQEKPPQKMLAEQRIVQLQQSLAQEKLTDQQQAQLITEERLFQEKMTQWKQNLVQERKRKIQEHIVQEIGGHLVEKKITGGIPVQLNPQDDPLATPAQLDSDSAAAQQQSTGNPVRLEDSSYQINEDVASKDIDMDSTATAQSSNSETTSDLSSLKAQPISSKQRASDQELTKKNSPRRTENHSPRMKGNTTKLFKQIQDQWVQLRSNTPSARAERERVVLAFSNCSQMVKHPVPSSVNTPLSLKDGVIVLTNKSTQPSHNKAICMSDGGSQDVVINQDQVDEVIDQDQVDEVIDQSDQDKASKCSTATHSVQTNARIRQTQLKDPAEETGNKESITVSRARTRLWRKPSTTFKNARFQAIWKHQADEELIQKNRIEEREAQKKLVQHDGLEIAVEGITKAQDITTTQQQSTANPASSVTTPTTSFTKLLYARLQTLGGGASTGSPHDPSEPAKSPISQTPSQSLQQNDNMSPAVHDVIHDHPYVPSHMIHNEYYTPEVKFSYKSPPPTDQPELLISIPRSSYTKPQLDGTTAEQGDEQAAELSQRKSSV